MHANTVRCLPSLIGCLVCGPPYPLYVVTAFVLSLCLICVCVRGWKSLFGSLTFNLYLKGKLPHRKFKMSDGHSTHKHLGAVKLLFQSELQLTESREDRCDCCPLNHLRIVVILTRGSLSWSFV